MTAVSALEVALCGCGNMGAPVAARLAGPFDLRVYDRDAELADACGRTLGASVAGSVTELARDAGALVLSLPNAAASRDVVVEAAPHLAGGAVVVETSTVAPADMVALQAVCETHALRLVDAAILSGVVQMREGRSILLVGGDDDAVALAAPVLDALAARQVRLGGIGSGMAAKVANNAVSHAVMVVLVEATALAQAAGVPPLVLADLLADPDGGLLRPLTHRLRERVLEGDFEGGMPTEAALKDSALALQMAADAGIPLYAVKGAHTPYELAVDAGHGRLDYAAISLLWEEWTGRSLRAEPKDGPTS